MMNLGMNFVWVPEGAISVNGIPGCNPNLDRSQVLDLFNQTDIATSNSTMLNPLNVKWFYENVNEGPSQT